METENSAIETVTEKAGGAASVVGSGAKKVASAVAENPLLTAAGAVAVGTAVGGATAIAKKRQKSGKTSAKKASAPKSSAKKSPAKKSPSRRRARPRRARPRRARRRRAQRRRAPRARVPRPGPDQVGHPRRSARARAGVRRNRPRARRPSAGRSRRPRHRRRLPATGSTSASLTPDFFPLLAAVGSEGDSPLPAIRMRGPSMRLGKWEIRPLGGGVGCLTMILISIIASILLTVLLNLVLRG